MSAGWFLLTILLWALVFFSVLGWAGKRIDRQLAELLEEIEEE